MRWIINNNVATEELRLQKNMKALSRIRLPQLLKSSLRNNIFPAITFARGLCIICLLYFKGTTSSNEIKEKFLVLKKATAIHVSSYFACGKTRLRCKKLTLNNKYTKSYIITLKCFQLVTYVYSWWWEIPVWSKPIFPKSQNMLSYYVKMLIRFYPSWEQGTLTR